MNMMYLSYLLSIMYICTFMRINIVIVIVIDRSANYYVFRSETEPKNAEHV